LNNHSITGEQKNIFQMIKQAVVNKQ